MFLYLDEKVSNGSYEINVQKNVPLAFLQISKPMHDLMSSADDTEDTCPAQAR